MLRTSTDVALLQAHIHVTIAAELLPSNCLLAITKQPHYLRTLTPAMSSAAHKGATAGA